jgi:hypothetical protein
MRGASSSRDFNATATTCLSAAPGFRRRAPASPLGPPHLRRHAREIIAMTGVDTGLGPRNTTSLHAGRTVA